MLDRLRVAVRPRSPWEAADLGVALLRDQARPAFLAWLAALLPPAVVLGVAFRHRPWLALLLLWWLKPLLDRPVLHVLAKATFGETPSLKDTFRALPVTCRRGLAATLLWRRLSPERSLLLPVWQLETPTGAAFRRRRKILLGRVRNQAQLLSFVGLLCTAALVLGTLAAIAFFWPVDAGPNPWLALFARAGRRLAWLDALLPFLVLAAMAVVEPFYLAAGFGLYLNRRVQLEAWDLELAFRQLGRRARSLGGGVLLALILVSLRLGAQPTMPTLRSRGQTPAGMATPSRTMPTLGRGQHLKPHSVAPSDGIASSGSKLLASPKATLEEVMKAPEFGARRPVWHLHLRHEPAPEPVRQPPAWLTILAHRLARLLRWLIPAALVALLLRLLWTHRTALGAALGGAAPVRAPERMFGLDIRPQALPADLPGAAARLWDQGDPRGALALLYRGALAHLAHGLHAPVNTASTEGECRVQADRALPEPAARYFARLLDAWQGAAYGGRVPPPGDRELCVQWAGHFPAPEHRP
jgi:hypothetical protein